MRQVLNAVFLRSEKSSECRVSSICEKISECVPQISFKPISMIHLEVDAENSIHAQNQIGGFLMSVQDVRDRSRQPAQVLVPFNRAGPRNFTDNLSKERDMQTKIGNPSLIFRGLLFTGGAMTRLLGMIRNLSVNQVVRSHSGSTQALR
ncbi:hypothetical protein RRG08_047769 [Elysia crispata]|uniref:Uncharacterized protein n=1 Tax=Elysia crispata TaxID=231223 RepID=A0AAE0YXL2_9GAST|nr:hypothetical protein RRG08_047769 [Elysia crispata]